VFLRPSTATASFSARSSVRVYERAPLRIWLTCIAETGLNLYDVRKTCDRQKDGSLCYRQMNWIDVGGLPYPVGLSVEHSIDLDEHRREQACARREPGPQG
jgi:hypothetical protein